MNRSRLYARLACLLVFLVVLRSQWAAKLSEHGVLASLSRQFQVTFPTSEDVYHILFRGRDLDRMDRPVDMTLGTIGPEGTMHDGAPMNGRGFYRVETIPRIAPHDTDGDGLDDVTELLDSVKYNPLNPGNVSSQNGAPIIPDRSRYEAMARRDNVPGAAGIREVKFLFIDVDTSEPKLFFVNTKRFIYHWDFATVGLGMSDLSLSDFNAQTYFTNTHRKNIAGSLLAHDNYIAPDGKVGMYSVEFWPTDPVSFHFVEIAYEMIAASLPFVEGNLAYHPAGETQRALYEEEKAQYAESHVRVITTEELFGNQTFSALNPGITFGRLRLVGADANTTFSARDIVIFQNIPNDLTHVAGIITEVPQTPLSHINLKAKQNDTPNAYIKNASADPRIAEYLDQYVLFEVTADGFLIKPATGAQVDDFLESIRPKETQTPPRDLTKTMIKQLGLIDFAESDAYGAKAANLSELRKILPDAMVPDGYAIPFSYYDAFMESQGLYHALESVLATEGFAENPAVRERALGQFQKTIKKASVPTWMEDDFEALRGRFGEGVPLRCRSSTNNEDLPGFNGAGLYDSFTHRPDEGPLSKSIKQVWASMWNYRAFEERDFYRIDHLQAAIGVVVYPSFSEEQANGVAVTKNIIDPNWTGYYVNVQVGEDLVTNPTENAIPEEFLVSLLLADADYTDYSYEVQYVRKSNRRVNGEAILSPEQIFELAGRMQLIQTHFRRLYKGSASFGMEIEFKVDVAGHLVIKQARPWIN